MSNNDPNAPDSFLLPVLKPIKKESVNKKSFGSAKPAQDFSDISKATDSSTTPTSSQEPVIPTPLSPIPLPNSRTSPPSKVHNPPRKTSNLADLSSKVKNPAQKDLESPTSAPTTDSPESQPLFDFDLEGVSLEGVSLEGVSQETPEYSQTQTILAPYPGQYPHLDSFQSQGRVAPYIALFSTVFFVFSSTWVLLSPPAPIKNPDFDDPLDESRKKFPTYPSRNPPKAVSRTDLSFFISTFITNDLLILEQFLICTRDFTFENMKIERGTVAEVVVIVNQLQGSVVLEIFPEEFSIFPQKDFYINAFRKPTKIEKTMIKIRRYYQNYKLVEYPIATADYLINEVIRTKNEVNRTKKE